MTVYKISTDDDAVYVSANLSHAASPILTYFGSDPFYDYDGEKSDYEGLSWQPTSYQTADARHRESLMAKLVTELCNMGTVISVEIIDDDAVEP